MAFPALLTDLYEVTMLAGYHRNGMTAVPAAFDLFFREIPFHGGYAVFAGLDTALDYLENLHFSDDDITYLDSLRLFSPSFLNYLQDFRFAGKVSAPPEGTVVFPHEPLLSVEGGLAEAQFVETALLNIVNFQTLVATKASRINHMAGGRNVVEFGLRRAHGPDGALSAARAACIGGVTMTSNVLAGKLFGLAVRGTHAHSWVMAFPDELSSFRAYAATFPDNCVLLVDTYNTLESGIPNAIKVAGELRQQGYELKGVRIDSGDLAYLSKQARNMLDQAGFCNVLIMASNELDEKIIGSIQGEGGMVDIYGVGTKLVTCMGEGGGALGGVYKLVSIDDRPKMKLTNDMSKATLPGRKRLLRAMDGSGGFIQDVISIAAETVRPGDPVIDPINPLHHTTIPSTAIIKELSLPVMEGGRRVLSTTPLEQLAGMSAEQLRRMPEGCLRLVNPHRYKVSISVRLHELRKRLIAEMEGKEVLGRE